LPIGFFPAEKPNFKPDFATLEFVPMSGEKVTVSPCYQAVNVNKLGPIEG
jgi:hypothetical protein